MLYIAGVLAAPAARSASRGARLGSWRIDQNFRRALNIRAPAQARRPVATVRLIRPSLKGGEPANGVERKFFWSEVDVDLWESSTFRPKTGKKFGLFWLPKCWQPPFETKQGLNRWLKLLMRSGPSPQPWLSLRDCDHASPKRNMLVIILVTFDQNLNKSVQKSRLRPGLQPCSSVRPGTLTKIRGIDQSA